MEQQLNFKKDILTTLTKTNLYENHIYLSQFIDVFPVECLGEHNKKEGEGVKLKLHLFGIREPVHTDIDKLKKIFRIRSCWAEFFSINNLKAGDQVKIRKISPYEYLVSPYDNNDSGNLANLSDQTVDRIRSEINRILRDNALARSLKALHKNKCQICGTILSLSNGESYSEAHHIQPLGDPHNGPDIEENILVLCPNHHVLCDYGAIKIKTNQLLIHPKHSIGKEYVAYHNSQIVQKRI